MVMGWDDALIMAAMAAASAGGGWLANQGSNKETKQQRTSRKTADELLSSLKGEGPFSNLFNMDDAAFKKSYVDPAWSQFRNRTAPEIQQQFIAAGQQRGTGMEDTLTRAGVDLDQLLNQQYATMQGGAQDRMSSALSSIVGMGGVGGAQRPLSGMQAAAQGGAGFLSSPAFSDIFKDAMKQPQQQPQQQPQYSSLSNTPKGFAQDWNKGYGY